MGIRKKIDHLQHDLGAYGLLKGLRVLSLKTRRNPYPKPITHSALGGSVWVRPGTSDLAVLDQIVVRGFLPSDLGPNTKVIVDLGSNIGLSARWFASHYPGARIIAVEPDPDNHALLLRNTNAIPSITCIHAGIWPSDGALSIERAGLGNSALRTNEVSSGGDVEGLSMQSLIQRCSIDRISLLKIDIEGSELDLFSSSSLSWLDRVDAIAIELHDRFRPGCTQAFFAALSSNRWNVEISGDMLICIRS